MKIASKFVVGTAALAMMSTTAFAAGAGGGQDSDDPMGIPNDTFRTEASQMDAANQLSGNALMGKSVMSSDGKLLGVVESVGPEADARERIYVATDKDLGKMGRFSVVVPQNYVPGDSIMLDMTAAEAVDAL